MQKALPLLNDGGSIILNGSVASVKGTAAFGVYAASKAAIRSFVRTWTTVTVYSHNRVDRYDPATRATTMFAEVVSHRRSGLAFDPAACSG